MKLKKRVLAILIITCIAVLAYCWSYYRLEIIRATIDAPLPWWLKALIWGW